MSNLVCIDPGHSWAKDTGGDPGACNGEYKESVAALEISYLLKEELERKGIKAILTREGGFNGMKLSQRTDFSNKNNANLFVSIHLNSADNKQAHGIETLRFGIVSDTTIRLADNVQEELILATKARDRGVKIRNDLYVLKHTKCPAVLVETGFISNDKECQKLFDQSYQLDIADAICRGIYYTLNKEEK